MAIKNKRAGINTNWSLRLLRSEADFLPKKLPSIRLRHGQAIWVMIELGFGGAVSRNTFHEYIKSLRKLGIPFGRAKFQTKHRRRLADYSYSRIMELALTLSLRVYHAVPDSVLKGIMHYRGRLDRLYRRAYAQRDRGAGRPIIIKVRGHQPIAFRGVFLDLNIKFSGGHMVHFGPPKLLSSIAALRQFSESTVAARPLLPISLSLLSEQIIVLARQVPDIRSGPQMCAARSVGRPLYRGQHFGEESKTGIILKGSDVNG